LRRVQKARIRKREKLLRSKRVTYIQNQKEKGQGKLGIFGRGGKRDKRHTKRQANKRYALARPNTPSTLTQFKQTSAHFDPTLSNHTVKPPASQSTTLTRSGSTGSTRRPQSSPSKLFERSSNPVVKNQGGGHWSMPALHAVTSPQRPFYPNQEHYQKKEKRHQQERSKRNKINQRNNNSRDASQYAKRKSSTQYTSTGKNKFGSGDIRSPPSLTQFTHLQKKRPATAVHQQRGSTTTSQRPSSAMSTNSYNFAPGPPGASSASSASSEFTNVHDPSQSWYTGHSVTDLDKLQSNLQSSLTQYQASHQPTASGTSSSQIRLRPSTASAQTGSAARRKLKRRPKTAVLQGAKDLLRMVQASKGYQPYPVIMRQVLGEEDRSRPSLPGWTTRHQLEDVGIALATLETAPSNNALVSEQQFIIHVHFQIASIKNKNGPPILQLLSNHTILFIFFVHLLHILLNYNYSCFFPIF